MYFSNKKNVIQLENQTIIPKFTSRKRGVFLSISDSVIFT